MAANQFVVDLGNVTLSTDQRRKMNAAIQSAVAGELANINLKKRIVLIPIDKWPKGPILDGIVIRDLDKRFNDILNLR
jgi:hypothetical protein